MKYGLPYKGSKSTICDWLLKYLPDCETFVDVFCGGCSVTHAMMLSNKAKNLYLNDIKQGIAEIFIDAISGKYKPDYHFVTRDEFFREKDLNAFISNFWSFGNDNHSYVYSKDVEPYRKACHDVIINNDYSEFIRLCPDISSFVIDYIKECDVSCYKKRRIALGKAIFNALKRFNENNVIIESNPLYSQYIPYLNGKAGLHISPCYHLDRIERLIELEANNFEGKFIITHEDYKNIDIPDNSVVYCDPPYKNSTGYLNDNEFNHNDFFDWCIYLKESKNCNIFISEYSIEDDRFFVISEKKKKVNYCATQTAVKTEKLYGIK